MKPKRRSSVRNTKPVAPTVREVSAVAKRVAKLLPYDYESLLLGAMTGHKTSDGMDAADYRRVPVPEGVDADMLERMMLSAHKKYPGAMVTLYGQRGVLKIDRLMIWTSGRGFSVPDYSWETYHLNHPTRRKVSKWVAGRGPNPAADK